MQGPAEPHRPVDGADAGGAFAIDAEPLIDDAWGERLVDAAQRERLRLEVLARLDQAARRRAEEAPELFLLEALRASPALPMSSCAPGTPRMRWRPPCAPAPASTCCWRGLRQLCAAPPAWSRGLQIFEIDHPATQRYKLERLRELGVVPDEGVHFIAADLAEESVADALSRSPYTCTSTSFFSWLGVTMYLTRRANLLTLRSIARCAPSGSRLSFTYLESRTIAEPSEPFPTGACHRAGRAVPVGLRPPPTGRGTRRTRTTLLDDVNGADAARYGRRAFARPGTSHLALAEVCDGI